MQFSRTTISPWLLLPILLLGIGIGAWIYSGRKTGDAVQGEQVPRSYRYLYYPASNVYFDPDGQRYSYPDAAGQWQQVTALPAALRLDSTQRVELVSTSKEIWLDNDDHRMRYAAQLYAKPKDFEAPPPPPPVAEKKVEEEKPKKENKVRKFFKKLFRKDKDKAE